MKTGPVQKTAAVLILSVCCVILSACGGAERNANDGGEVEKPAVEAGMESAAMQADSTTVQEKDEEQAVLSYKEFLAQTDLHRLTATPEYPRGDSRAVYAFADCTGDGPPELHLRGGNIYQIYTFCEGEVIPLYSYDLRWKPTVIPLKNGAFVGCARFEYDSDGLYTAYLRIPPKDDPFDSDRQKPGKRYRDFYFYEVLDAAGQPLPASPAASLPADPAAQTASAQTTALPVPGSHYFSMALGEKPTSNEAEYYADGVQCDEKDWETLLAPYRSMMEDDSLQLDWEYVFPEKEWSYLDALEEGNREADWTADCTPEAEAWGLYKRVLSGDFSFIKSLGMRSHMVSNYTYSLDPDTGRSCWKYILLDITKDGAEDLIIRYQPEEDDYTSADFDCGSWGGIAFFSWQDGRMIWDELDITHESYIPLRNGQMILWSNYGVTAELRLGDKTDLYSRLKPEKEYTRLTVSYDEYMHDREWYIDTFGSPGEKEGIYYTVSNYDENGDYVDTKTLSENEWREIEADLKTLLIPDSEWKPASVFLPKRHQEEFTQG